jgi:hypothetical protein
LDHGMEDTATEAQVLSTWREQEVRVTLLDDESAVGRLKGVTDRAIIIEDDEDRSILCPWSAVKMEKESPAQPMGCGNG